MSQINPFYQYRVLKLLPRACPIPVAEADKAGKPDEELFTDGVLIELTDAAGKNHNLTIHRAVFPLGKGKDEQSKVQPGATGYLYISSEGEAWIDISDFHKP